MTKLVGAGEEQELHGEALIYNEPSDCDMRTILSCYAMDASKGGYGRGLAHSPSIAMGSANPSNDLPTLLVDIEDKQESRFEAAGELDH